MMELSFCTAVKEYYVMISHSLKGITNLPSIPPYKIKIKTNTQKLKQYILSITPMDLAKCNRATHYGVKEKNA